VVDFVEQVALDRDDQHLNLFAQPAAHELVIPDHFVDRERNILLRLECNDFVDLCSVERRQFHKAHKDRLRRDCVIHRRVMNLHFPHHLAYDTHRFVQREVRVTTLPGLRIEGRFAQPIIYEDQSAVDRSKFCETDRLRSEVESDQAGRAGHGVKALNRNSKMQTKISTAKSTKYSSADNC
jgi:hypothetical protein